MLGFNLSSRGRVVRPVSTLALAAVVATLAACGADKKGVTGPPTNVVGTYSLATVDGNALPFTVPNNPSHTIVVQSATVTLNADHTYTIGGTGTSDGGAPEQVIADAGDWSLSGSTVTFTSGTHSGLIYAGTATTTNITESVPGAFAGSTNTSFLLVLNKTA